MAEQIFRAKLNLGEIAWYVHDKKRNRDDFVKVTGVSFAIGFAEPIYTCRYPNGLQAAFPESELEPDPDFNADEVES